MKPQADDAFNFHAQPAAFGRLCVETAPPSVPALPPVPAAFGRLCVETFMVGWLLRDYYPAAFGRLCVETPPTSKKALSLAQPPSGGCVLKHYSIFGCKTGGSKCPPYGNRRCAYHILCVAVARIHAVSGCLRMQNGWAASAHPTEPALAALSRICVTCFYCANKSFRASDMVGWVNIWLRT